MTSHILLIITGSIAICKVPDLINILKEKGCNITCVMTASAQEFITPETLTSLTDNPVYTEIFSPEDDSEMDHIQLSRQTDLVIVAPATANMLAKMTHGYADDLASTLLLATDKPVMAAPAMNVQMWEHSATQRNIAQLISDGIEFIGPDEGMLACGEYGTGRMSTVETIANAILNNKPLAGKKALITSGPTYEPIDPVRFIGNHSSGKQGHAIAQALANAGADVTLVTGPVNLKDPTNVTTHHVTTAHEMLDKCINTLPADIAICAAAVSDWRPTDYTGQKIKKHNNNDTTLTLTINPDILATLSQHTKRPSLVIGFAAETENLIQHAKDKHTSKQCDWILANDVSQTESTFGSDTNHVHLITKNHSQDWGVLAKSKVAERLVKEIVQEITTAKDYPHPWT